MSCNFSHYCCKWAPAYFQVRSIVVLSISHLVGFGFQGLALLLAIALSQNSG